MKDDLPLLVETGNGFSIKYRKKTLYSLADPVRGAERLANSCEIKNKTLIFIPSPLLFYGVDSILKDMPEDCHIICVEVDQNLMALSIKNTIPDLLKHPKITYFRTDDIGHIAYVLTKIGLWKFRRTVKIVLNGGSSLYSIPYDSMFGLIEREIQSYWQNKITLIRIGRKLINNLFINLNHLTESYCFTGFSTSKSVLIAGAGEGLETSLPFIKKERKRFFILAVDTSLPVLLKNRISPDLVLILESQFANIFDFYDTKNSTIPILCDLTSYPGVIKNFKGKKYFFISEFDKTKIFSRLKNRKLLPEVFSPAGSVGILAVDIALKITKAPILITGLDFSYKIGKPHAKGSFSHVFSLINIKRFNPIPMYKTSLARPLFRVNDKNNKTCITDKILYAYSLLLNKLISDKKNIFDINPGAGVFYGGRKIEKDQILTITGNPESSSDSLLSNTASTVEKGDILDFLNNEKSILSSIVDISKKILNRGIAEKDKTRIEELLSEADYVFIDFPDTPPILLGDINFYKRIIISAENYLIKINQAIQLTEL